MRALVRAAVVAAMLAAGGCLVSETPLFDAGDAHATPLAPGRYSVCSHSTDDDDSDCNPVEISVDASGLYLLAGDGDVVEARFRKVKRKAWAAQMTEGNDEIHYYFGAVEDGVFTLTLMWCENLPKKLRDRLVKSGDLEVERDNQMCVAKSARAVVAAAKAYARGEAQGDRIYLRFHPDAAS